MILIFAQRDCIQWTINASGKSHNPNLADIMHRTMGLLVASAHQIPSVRTKTGRVIYIGIQHLNFS